MTVMFDRGVFYDGVRDSLFSGHIHQDAVDGMDAILNVWEWLPDRYPSLELDLRWLAYMLATTYHETSKEMWPIEEYGQGAGQSYGEPDPETGQTYYGRGFVQLTWRDNYVKATDELELQDDDDLEWHAEQALDLIIAAKVMFKGMYEGWFRPPNDLIKYFDDDVDDPYEAREIINGDKKTVPSWSNGVSIGNLIVGYHNTFLDALQQAYYVPEPEPELPVVNVTISVDRDVVLYVNGQQITQET